MSLKKWLLSLGSVALCLAIMSGTFVLWNLSFAPSLAVTVRIDGQPVDVETRERTVGSLLADMSINTNPGDILKPSAPVHLRDGMEIRIDTEKTIDLLIDGQTQAFKTNAATVGEALKSAGIDCGKDDLVVPELKSHARDGLKISMQKASYQEVIETEKINNNEVRKNDDTLLRGTTKVIKKGHDGEIRRTYKACLRGGKEIYRKQISEETVSVPEDELLAIGTKNMVLASRHNDLANSGAAQPAQQPENDEAGAIAPQPQNVQEGTASYYTLNGKGIGMTAAHRTLPFGTIVRVTNLNNNKTVTVRINDRGPYLPGRVIDLATDAFRVIAPTSAGLCPVRLEW